MYIPIENSLHFLYEDSELINLAYKANVIIVGTSSLLTTIRLVIQLMAQQKQQESVNNIVQAGTSLFETFSKFCEDLLDIKHKFEALESQFNTTINRFKRGNKSLFSQVQALKDFGITTTKEIPAELLDNNENRFWLKVIGELNFINDLISISIFLKYFPEEERLQNFKDLLNFINNENLPSQLYDPLSLKEIDYQIGKDKLISIDTEFSYTINTKERVPCLMIFEFESFKKKQELKIEEKYLEDEEEKEEVVFLKENISDKNSKISNESQEEDEKGFNKFRNKSEKDLDSPKINEGIDNNSRNSYLRISFIINSSKASYFAFFVPNTKSDSSTLATGLFVGISTTSSL